jgi:hypothetical protein
MKLSIYKHIGFGLAVLFLLGGCSSGSPYMKTDKGPGHSMVYGYIDMKEAPAKLGWVSMKRVRPRVEKPYYSFWIRDGAFYSINIPHGSYHFAKFGGFNGWTNTEWNFNFPSQGRGALDPKIKRNRTGMYYVGSWKYKKVKTGFFKPGKFDLVRTKSVSEKEILKRMLPYAKHEKWKKMIEKRLRQL